LIKKYVTYVLISLVIFVGLNYYFSYSTARNLERQLDELHKKLPEASLLQNGNVSISPFVGDVLLESITFEDKQNKLFANSKNIVLDLTYFDFLKIYIMGSQAAFKHITGAKINVEAVKFGKNEPDRTEISSDDVEISLVGNLLSFLQTILTKRLPSTDFSYTANAKNLEYHDTTRQQLLAKSTQIKSSFDTNSGVARIDYFSTKGGNLSSEFECFINFNINHNRFSHWDKATFKTTFSYRDSTASTLSYSSPYGLLSARRVSVSAEMASVAYYKRWFQKIINLQGDFSITVNKPEIKPAKKIEDGYGFFLNPFRDENRHILFDQFTMEGKSTPELLTIENMLLSHELFDLSFNGRIIKNMDNFKGSVIQNGLIIVNNLDPKVKNIIFGAARLAGYRISDTEEKVTLTVKGTLENPKIRFN